MPEPTPGEIAYEQYMQTSYRVDPRQPGVRYGRLGEREREAWEAVAVAVLTHNAWQDHPAAGAWGRLVLSAWDRQWLADPDHYATWSDAEREVWCLMLEKYVGDHALARAIYDRTPLPEEDPPHA